MTRDAVSHPPHSLKQKVQLWEQTYQAQLTRVQQRILHEIGQELDYAYSLGIWRSDQTPEEIEQLVALRNQDKSQWPQEVNDYVQATRQYDTWILKAWQVGLADHPLVVEWVLQHRSVGSREILRRAKSEIDRGTQAPIEEGEADLINEVLQRHAVGESLRSVYRCLIEQKRLRISWQAFHKWVKRRDLTPSEPLALWCISQDVWEQVAILIEQYDPPRATGRPRIDPRVTLEAIVHQQRTGAAWHKLPAAFPDYRSVHRTFRRWQELGLLRLVWPILQAEWTDLAALH